jgi:hypothetical protein
MTGGMILVSCWRGVPDRRLETASPTQGLDSNILT